MKKTIVTLGIALVAISNFALASGTSIIKTEKTNHFSIAIPKTTPLCVAIQKGETDLVKKLIEYGADVNETSAGLTPLMVAARYNKVEIIKLLLANGAHTYIKDEKGFTALKYAELSMANEAATILKQA